VKWYRGNFEIFRFIQEESPPTKIFPLDHFHIDVSFKFFTNTLLLPIKNDPKQIGKLSHHFCLLDKKN
jgi:hypothetical protein